MKSCAITIASYSSVVIFAAFTIAGLLPPTVNTPADASQHLVARATKSVPNSLAVSDSRIPHMHPDEETGATQNLNPSCSAAIPRTRTSTSTPPGSTDGIDNSRQGGSSALENAYRQLTPADIVAYNNPGPVIPNGPLPPVISSSQSERTTPDVVPGTEPPSKPGVGGKSADEIDQTAAEVVAADNPGPVIFNGPLPPIISEPKIKARSVIGDVSPQEGPCPGLACLSKCSWCRGCGWCSCSVAGRIIPAPGDV